MKKKSIVCLLIISLIFIYGISIYAFADESNTPNQTIIIQNNTIYCDTENPIFNKETGMLYPGCSERKGVLRIENKNGSSIRINKLGMGKTTKDNQVQLPEIIKNGEKVDSEISDYYMSNINITINYTDWVNNLLKNNIFENSIKTFKDLWNNGEGAECSITIPNNNSIDLIYTITMNESADNRVQGIEANTEFTVGVNEIVTGHTSRSVATYSAAQSTGSDEHLAHDCIKTLIEKGVIEGYEDKSIKPENKLTRAEAAVLIGKNLKLETKGTDYVKYKDDLPIWAKKYIVATTQSGIFTGYDGNVFKPYENISRQEMVVVLIRAYKIKMKESVELSFKDKEDIAEWAIDYIKISAQNKIIEGYPDKYFRPQMPITRGEIFTLLCKLAGYHEEQKK